MYSKIHSFQPNSSKSVLQIYNHVIIIISTKNTQEAANTNRIYLGSLELKFWKQIWVTPRKCSEEEKESEAYKGKNPGGC